MDKLQDGDKILIAEACNHSRIKEKYFINYFVYKISIMFNNYK